MTVIACLIQWWARTGSWRIIGGAVIVSKGQSASCWVSRQIGWTDTLTCPKIVKTKTKSTKIGRTIRWCIWTGNWTIFGGDTWFWICFLQFVGRNSRITDSIPYHALQLTIHTRKWRQSNDRDDDILGRNFPGLLIELWAFQRAIIQNVES